MTHALKTWPEYYKAVEDGSKNFEVRFCGDREFKVGDRLLLQEWDNKAQKYTGKELNRIVMYVLEANDKFGIAYNFCVMGLKDSSLDY